MMLALEMLRASVTERGLAERFCSAAVHEARRILAIVGLRLPVESIAAVAAIPKRLLRARLALYLRARLRVRPVGCCDRCGNFVWRQRGGRVGCACGGIGWTRLPRVRPLWEQAPSTREAAR